MCWCRVTGEPIDVDVELQQQPVAEPYRVPEVAAGRGRGLQVEILVAEEAAGASPPRRRRLPLAVVSPREPHRRCLRRVEDSAGRGNLVILVVSFFLDLGAV